MAIIKCEYCGTPYDPDREICPLCGIPEDQYTAKIPVVREAPTPAPVPVEPPIATKSREHRVPNPQPQPRTKKKERPEKEKNEDGMPKGLVVLICVVLTLTLLVGAGFLLLKLGVFDAKTSEKAPDTNLELPFEEEKDPAQEEEASAGEVIACTALDVDYKEINLFAAGDTAPLKAQVTPANATEVVQWSSSDEEVCTVDPDGKITAVSGGVATITLTCGDFTTTSVVSCVFEGATPTPETVDPAETPDEKDEDVQDFTAVLNLTDFTLFEAGEFADLKVSGVPSGVDMKWSIANPAVATLEDGKVTAVSSGTTKVTVTVGDQKLECIVRCNFPKGDSPEDAEVVTGDLSISHTDVMVVVGEQFVISVSGTNAEVVWTSDNTGICTVNAGGTVTATGSGTTNVSTTVGDETLSCIVRVR